MIAQRSDYPSAYMLEETIKAIMGAIREAVPVGFNHQASPQEWIGFNDAPDIPIIQTELSSARKQLGTLGGGNHFIELQKGDDGYIWIMIHSGSRNFGKKIADFYNNRAVQLCELNHRQIPDPELAYLWADEEDGEDYITCMNYALRFALANRELMMQKAVEAFRSVVRWKNGFSSLPINIHHNYAALSTYAGMKYWIHRKGATSAQFEQDGIIPGSMGTPSYIVEGLGNPDSFYSSSHGAGRRMGRGAASRNLTVEQCDAAMAGIVFGRWGKDRKGRVDLGEAPGAYKDIEEVMDAQSDLVTPIIKLRPIGVIKG